MIDELSSFGPVVKQKNMAGAPDRAQAVTLWLGCEREEKGRDKDPTITFPITFKSPIMPTSTSSHHLLIVPTWEPSLNKQAFRSKQ
jgi:hypothetical protein